jgi:hypothetical protein
MIILRTLGNISNDTRKILHEYINYRIDLSEHILFKERDNSFVIYGASKNDEDLFILEVVLYDEDNDNEFIKVRYANIDKKEIIDCFKIYEDGIVGYLGSHEKEFNIKTIFRGDVVIPDSSDKTNLVWLEGYTNKEIFKFGLDSYKVLRSDNIIGGR